MLDSLDHVLNVDGCGFFIHDDDHGDLPGKLAPGESPRVKSENKKSPESRRWPDLGADARVAWFEAINLHRPRDLAGQKTNKN